MGLSLADPAALEPRQGNPLDFAPSTWSVLPLKAHYIMDIAPVCHGLNLFDFTNDLKNHKESNFLAPTTVTSQ